jgi:DNA-binding MarR family transcriptional regulator
MPVHMRILGNEDEQTEKDNPAIRADLLHAFQQLSVQLNGRSHRLLYSTGITPLQLGVLRYIREQHSPPGLTTLSDAFQLRMPTMTQVVHTLVRKGYLLKRISRSDSRGRHLSLTAKGRRILDRVQPQLSQSLDLTSLSQNDAATCLQLLTKVITATVQAAPLP